jgi:prokaryotic ubiquitin-like protein Pup
MKRGNRTWQPLRLSGRNPALYAPSMTQERTTKSKSKSKQSTTVEQVEEVSPERQAEIDALKAETDSMLDEIDGVLEQNAEEFVREYVQKGGE